MEEVWKDVKGYEGLYQVSNIGRVKSLPRLQVCRFPRITHERILNWCIEQSGYASVRLYDKGGKPKRIKVHRLVAENFIENPNIYPCINHKDENKLNNKAENLEWCTSKYNTNYGSAIEKSAIGRRKIIIAENEKTKEILTFVGGTEAAKYFNTHKSYIWRICKKEIIALGYKWKYGIKK